MLKLYRNVVMVGLVGLGLAACGDKVTVTQPVTPTPGVTSVSVAPQNLTIAINQEVQYAASVIADAGVAVTVTWSSGNSAIATVDANGKVKGIAAGTTTITATSTADVGKKGIASVTVSAVPPSIISFTITPTTATLAPGNFVQISPAFVMNPGTAAPTPTYSTSNAAVATVDASGKVVAVAAGTAIITATAVSGTSTLTATLGVTVRALIPATVSISSVTTGILTLPVNLTNVNGQIEFNLNFNPGEQTIDSIAVFIGAKRAAKQTFVTNPAAGIITLSVNTANFTKNPAAGTATVDYLNGNSTISAAIYPRNVATATATETTPIVLNNVDGWAADITKPTNSAIGVGGANVGFTYWGGPTAPVSAILYPVIYTPGRSINNVTWGFGPGGTAACTYNDATLPFTNTFGGNGTIACAYQNTTVIRDNIVVTLAVDNNLNSYPLVNAVTPLIANTVVLGATPDSLRLDYVGPNSVSSPLIAGAAGFNWVNAAWVFKPTGTIVTDLGVGPLASSWAAFAGLASGSTYPTSIVTGADLAETNTNSAVDGYRARATATDLLGNPTNSAAVLSFGVDKTAPSIRYATVAELANLRTYALPLDTVTVVAAPAAGSPLTLWAVDAIDNRSGLYTTPLSGVLKGVDQTVTKLVTGSPLQTNVSVAGDDAYIPGALVDGYRQTVAVPVWGSAGGQTNTTTGYYTYTVTIRDEAGNAVDLSNATGAIAQRRYAIDNLAPVAVGLSMPFTFGSSALSLAGTFQFSASDDLEVISAILGINPGAIPGFGQPIVFPALTVGTKYDGTLAGAVAVVANLTTPVLATVSTPDFWAGIQVLCDATNACTDGSTDLGGPIVAGATIQPVSVFANAVDVFGTPSAATTSGILPGSLPATTELTLNTYDGVGSISSVNGIQVRYQPSVSATTVRQVSNFSVTLPQLARLDLFKLVAGQWVYQTTLAGSAGVGSDNGLERFWDYNFGSALTAAGTYAVISFYNGPQTAAVGTALWFTFTK